MATLSDEELQARQDATHWNINAMRDEKTNGGVYVKSIDKWIDSDATATLNLLSAKATFEELEDVKEVYWTCADNSIITLNEQNLKDIWRVLFEARTHNHAVAIAHKAAMLEVEDPFAYDFSQGWTKTYDEYVAEQEQQSAEG